MVGLLKLKTLERKEFADFCQPEIYYSCSTIWYLMRIWQADCYFFFHMANWKMWLFDLYFNYTPSDLSPLHFLSNTILESKHILTFSISPASQMDKENLISLCFSDLPVLSGGLKKMFFVTSKEFREELPMECMTATTLGTSQLPGTLLFPCHCSSHRRGVISCFRHCYYLISS